MSENFRARNSRAKVYSSGKMDRAIVVNGRVVNSMGWVLNHTLVEHPILDSLTKARGTELDN